MPSRMYVLESEWSWDHANTELATMSFEETDVLPETALFNQDHAGRDTMLENVRKIFEGQCPRHGGYRLKRLWYAPNGVLLTGRPGSASIEPSKSLELVCTFDKAGTPIRPETSSLQQGVPTS